MKGLLGFFGLGDDTDDGDVVVSGYEVMGAPNPNKTSGGSRFDSKNMKSNPTPPKQQGKKGPVRGAPPARRLAPSEKAKKHPRHATRGAVALANRADRAGARALKSPKRAFKPITTVKGIFGDEILCVGAVPVAPKKSLTPKQQAAVKKYNDAVKKLNDKDATAKKAGTKARQIAKMVRADVKNAKGFVKSMMAKQTKMKGIFGETVGEGGGYEEIVGGGEYEEIVGVSENDVIAYCAMTGEDPSAVIGLLEERGVLVHGYDPNAFHDYSKIVGDDITVFGDQAEADAAYAALAEAKERALAEAEAALAAEQAARASGGTAIVKANGACRCPKCGTGLRLVLAPPPGVPRGRKAGAVVPSTPASRRIVGASLAKKARPALRAATPGSCLCACPGCGTTLCLSVGPSGYDAKRVNAEAPRTYAAVAQAVHGDDVTVFGFDGQGLLPGQVGYDPETAVTVFGADEWGRSPGQPGYDPSTDPDAGGGGGGEDYYTETPEEPPPVEKEVPPLNLPIVDTLPDDVIPYAEQKQYPDLEFGSYSYFFGPQEGGEGRPARGKGAWGFIWGWKFMNDSIKKNPSRWILRHGQDHSGTDNWDDGWGSMGGDKERVAKVSEDSIRGVKHTEGGGNGAKVENNKYKNFDYYGPWYGPLIGNPDGDFKNLRWSVKDKKWFWFIEEAPEWALVEAKYAAAKIEEAKRAAEKAAKEAEAAAAAKEQAEIDAADAKAKAEMALAEEQAYSQSLVDDTRRAGEEKDADLAQRKAEQEQARHDAELARQDAALAQQQYQAELEAQKAQATTYAEAMKIQMQIEQQQAQIDLQRQQAEAAYRAANPEQFYSPQAQAPQQQYAQPDDRFSQQGEGGLEYSDERVPEEGLIDDGNVDLSEMEAW